MKPRRVWVAGLFAAVAAVTSCDDPSGPGDGVREFGSCESPSERLDGDLGGRRLSGAAGPYLVPKTVTVEAGALVLGAGTVLCFEPGAGLDLSETLRSEGTAAEPVILRARDRSRGPWAGIRTRTPDSVVLRHAVLVDATQGLDARLGGSPVRMEDVELRRIAGPGVSSEGGGVFRRIVADSVCAACDPSSTNLFLGHAAGLGDVTIRNSPGSGLLVRVENPEMLAASNLTFEHIGGYAFYFDGALAPPTPDFSATSTWTFVDVGTPAVVASGAAAQLVAGVHIQAPEGPPRFDLVGPGLPVATRLVAGIDWHLGNSMIVHDLVFDPGASLALDDEELDVRGIVTEGTQALPVTIAGPGRLSVFTGSSAPRIEWTHVPGGVTTTVRADGARLLRSTFQDAPTVIVEGNGVDFVGTRFLSSQGDAVRVEGDRARFSACEVVGASGDGIVVTARIDAPVIELCNFDDLEGDAVVALGSEPVLATRSWWGAPGGPGAAGAEGVRGPVAVEAPRAGPVDVDAVPSEPGAPTSIVVPDTFVLETGTARRIPGSVRDAEGRLAAEQRFVIYGVSGEQAMIDPADSAVVVGVRPGSVVVHLRSRADPTVQADLTVEVEAGELAFEWSQAPQPERSRIFDVWGESHDDVVVVGRLYGDQPSGIDDEGLTMHYNGLGWNVGGGYGIRDVDGTGGAVWGVDGHKLVRLSDDRRTWEIVVDDPAVNLTRVWAASSDVVYVQDGFLRRHRPGSGADVIAGDGYCRQMAAASETQIYLACGDGSPRLQVWDGSALTTLPQIPGQELGVLWWSGQSLWSVGESGRVFRWDGVAWTSMEPGIPHALWTIDGTGDDDVYVGGPDHTLLHWDGAGWKELWVPGLGPIRSVHVVEGWLFVATDEGLLVGRPIG